MKVIFVTSVSNKRLNISFVQGTWLHILQSQASIKDPETVILSGDKDSCVVIMNKNDYINKVQDMINK